MTDLLSFVHMAQGRLVVSRMATIAGMWIACIISVLAYPSAAMCQVFDLERALLLPLSPGSVALLVEHSTDARALERVGTALSDPRPEVRASAARVAYVWRSAALLPEAEAGLAREADRSAANELMRFVAAQGGPAKSDLVVQSAERLSMASVAGIELATAQRQLALKHLETLRALEERFPLESFLALATRGSLDVLGPQISVALRESDTELWSAYLAAARTTDGETVDNEVQPPKKIKDVNPFYPESARQDRVQGIVILQATVTTRGCVRQVEVLRSVDERLDLAAIIAVSQWKYEPTLWNGAPVPIVMTVTVNFTLS